MSYDAHSITVLEGLEAVRKRPGMYIGSTGERGLHHLVQEVVDNAVDEALAGYCDRIDVTLLADGGVRVTDNGRGIPVDEHPVEKRPAVEVVLTTLHAGGKFDSKSYAVSGGLHGVGVSVVNALASRFEVEVRRDGFVWRQSYQASEPVTPLTRGEPTEETGTIITFWPDANIFETTDWDYETLRRRLQEMAFLNRGLADQPDRRAPGARGHRERRRAGQAAVGAVLLRGRHRRLRPVPERVQGAGARYRHRLRRGRRRDLGRDRHAVEQQLRGVGAHVRQHDQHRGGRHPRGRLPGRADHDREQLRPGPEAGPGEGRAAEPARTSARDSPRSSTSS